tara:strand:- start:102 stop:551 length:450 start_codon:yes stop_codon:yes gene_type:complete
MPTETINKADTNCNPRFEISKYGGWNGSRFYRKQTPYSEQGPTYTGCNCHWTGGTNPHCRVGFDGVVYNHYACSHGLYDDTQCNTAGCTVNTGNNHWWSGNTGNNVYWSWHYNSPSWNVNSPDLHKLYDCCNLKKKKIKMKKNIVRNFI